MMSEFPDTRSFDLDGRLTSYPLDGTHNRTVGYDLASRVDALTDTAASQTIGYDAKSEITSYTGPYGNGNETLTYDADGNRLTLAVAAGTASYTVPISREEISIQLAPAQLQVELVVL